MAFGRKGKKRKKYSLVERQKYHSNIITKVVNKYTKSNGVHRSIDFEKIESVISKSPKLQYSEGFTANKNVRLDDKSKSFIKGYNAARKAEEKSHLLKF